MKAVGIAFGLLFVLLLGIVVGLNIDAARPKVVVPIPARPKCPNRRCPNHQHLDSPSPGCLRCSVLSLLPG